MSIIESFQGKRNKRIDQDMVCKEELDRIAEGFTKPMFWSFGKIMAASSYLIDQRNVRGIIYLVAFGCGLMHWWGPGGAQDTQKGVPFCMITIDEHTGEAGWIQGWKPLSICLNGGILKNACNLPHMGNAYSDEIGP